MTTELLSSAPEQAQNPDLHPNFNFVFSRHLAEDGKAVAESLKDFDVIVLEEVAVNEKTRQLTQNADNMLVSTGLTGQQVDEIYEEVGLHGSFKGELLYNLQGTNKKIVLVDVNQDDPIFQELNARDRQATNEVIESIRSNQPNDVVRQKSIASLRAMADTTRYREQVVAGQLRNLDTDHDIAPGTKVGVFVGAVHTPVQHEISKDRNTTRTFVEDPESPTKHDREKFRYNIGSTIVRQLNMMPENEIDEATANRQVLLDTYRVMTSEDPIKTHNEVVAAMSDDEVGGLLQEIDAAKLARKLKIFKLGASEVHRRVQGLLLDNVSRQSPDTER